VELVQKVHHEIVKVFYFWIYYIGTLHTTCCCSTW